jgi:protein-S-isoprenylcysteine O-methyltransferase Ste14
MARTPLWKNSRGEWYVVGQFVLLLLVGAGPRAFSGLPAWNATFAQTAFAVGALFLLFGAYMAVWGMIALGDNLTPVPFPKDGGTLVESGPYRIVRHPIYSGLVFASFGWGLLVHGWLTILYAALLFVLLDVKSRREERWLMDRFSGYAAFRKRVRKLIPFLY